jgi:hypothetical protein
MGLLQQIQNGARFTRETVSLTNTPVSGSTSVFGSTYILLSVSVNNPCRIRLYSDSASVGIDDPRTTASFDLSASVGLVLDTLITSQSYKLNFDPPIIGTTFSASNTWYNISGSNVTATFTYYPIESEYGSKSELAFTAPNLPSGFSQLGDMTSPKSFLILSASCNYANARLRIYSRNINSISPAEKARPFSTPPTDASSIITDMIFDSASYSYKLSPVLQGYNLQTYTVGENNVGYILENLSGGAMTNVVASLCLYPVED